MTGAPLLQARGVVASLGGRRVVDDVSLTLHAGLWGARVGPTGAGKSTLLPVLAGLLPAAAGEVALQGRPLAAWPARERAARLAWLAQQGQTDAELPARSLVELGRLPRHGLLGAPDAADAAAVARALAETETLALGDRRLSELSGGERPRVRLARARAVEAAGLLLVEPVA
ncbi:MAG: ATP-binding cassette domain-containing protein, partial [Betaproteobacteria bacterium]